MDTLHGCYTMRHSLVGVHGNKGFQKYAAPFKQLLELTVEDVKDGILGVGVDEELKTTSNEETQGDPIPPVGEQAHNGVQPDGSQNVTGTTHKFLERNEDEDEIQFVDPSEISVSNTGPRPSLRPRVKQGSLNLSHP
jgi:hypothetical protein